MKGEVASAPVPAAPPRVMSPVPAPVPAPAPAATAVLKPIFFDCNKAVIRPDAAETLKANLEWFRQYPARPVTIVGNADVTGSAKHNKWLGMKRARAARTYLVGLGVAPGRLKTVSYGEAKPVCRERNEWCWSKERRVDFRL
jgi:peptidoglycan-associated lipoprotein